MNHLPELITKAQELLKARSLEIILSTEYGSANSVECDGWRQKLEMVIQAHLSKSQEPLSHSISHTHSAGGVAFLNASEGAIGFDVEVTNRVTPAVALRVGDAKQFQEAPTPAALFVAKEASFKAMRGARQPKVISEIEILEWLNCPFLVPAYTFLAKPKLQSFQLVGAIFQLESHTVGLSVIPHST